VRNGGAARRLGIAAVVVVAVLGSASVRLVGEGRASLAASDAALAERNFMAAAVHARAAARAYVPWAAHMQRGVLTLGDIAETSERRGDTEAALFAWRALLSAATVTRPFSPVGDKVRADAEASIARLSAEMMTRVRAESRGDRARAAESSITTAAVVPKGGWGALLLAGACLWWSAGRRLTSRGWGSDGRLVPKEIRVGVGMALVGLLGWLTALLLG
jgi:hypothetical protein